MQIINELKRVGLTETEARVLLGLYELGECKTGTLCKKVSIPSSNIYAILHSLIDKGVVTYKIVNNTKMYSANEPQSLKAIFHAKRKELDDLERNVDEVIARLRSIPKQKETLSDYKYFEGLSGIKSLWLEVDEVMKKGTTIDIYTGTVEAFQELTQFYLEEHHNSRKLKNVHERMLMPLNSKKEVGVRKNAGNIEFRFLDKKNEAEFAVFDSYLIIQHTGKEVNKPRGFFINDHAFADSFKDIFNKLWAEANKTDAE
jgi:sugar-specific transcriptional regulator TrmB